MSSTPPVGFSPVADRSKRKIPDSPLESDEPFRIKLNGSNVRSSSLPSTPARSSEATAAIGPVGSLISSALSSDFSPANSSPSSRRFDPALSPLGLFGGLSSSPLYSRPFPRSAASSHGLATPTVDALKSRLPSSHAQSHATPQPARSPPSAASTPFSDFSAFPGFFSPAIRPPKSSSSAIADTPLMAENGGKGDRIAPPENSSAGGSISAAAVSSTPGANLGSGSGSGSGSGTRRKFTFDSVGASELQSSIGLTGANASFHTSSALFSSSSPLSAGHSSLLSKRPPSFKQRLDFSSTESKTKEENHGSPLGRRSHSHGLLMSPNPPLSPVARYLNGVKNPSSSPFMSSPLAGDLLSSPLNGLSSSPSFLSPSRLVPSPSPGFGSTPARISSNPPLNAATPIALNPLLTAPAFSPATELRVSSNTGGEIAPSATLATGPFSPASEAFGEFAPSFITMPFSRDTGVAPEAAEREKTPEKSKSFHKNAILAAPLKRSDSAPKASEIKKAPEEKRKAVTPKAKNKRSHNHSPSSASSQSDTETNSDESDSSSDSESDSASESNDSTGSESLSTASSAASNAPPPPQPPADFKPCNCKKSKCLKLYCECFARQGYCIGCNCTDCNNIPKHEAERQKAIAATKERDSKAFFRTAVETSIVATREGKVVHVKGCNCKKSHCLKKYCECFQIGVKCSEVCKCCDCKNGGCNGADANHAGKTVEDEKKEKGKGKGGKNAGQVLAISTLAALHNDNTTADASTSISVSN